MPNGDKAQNTFIHIASSKQHQAYSLQCFDYLHNEASNYYACSLLVSSNYKFILVQTFSCFHSEKPEVLGNLSEYCRCTHACHYLGGRTQATGNVILPRQMWVQQFGNTYTLPVKISS